MAVPAPPAIRRQAVFVMSHSLAAIQMADALVAAQVEAANRRA
jgi:hypothetical protein